MPEIESFTTLQNPSEAAAHIRRLHPDILLLDINLDTVSDVDGIALASGLKKELISSSSSPITASFSV